MACRDAVKEKGLDRITVEDLVQVETLTPLSSTQLSIRLRRLPRKEVN